MERSALAISDLVSKTETGVCDGYIFLPCGQKLPAEALNCRDDRECRVMRREPQNIHGEYAWDPFLVDHPQLRSVLRLDDASSPGKVHKLMSIDHLKAL